MNSQEKKANRLMHSKSPYLKQHAYNPVNWYAWDDEALDTARRENKPILLSIGYAACHWCHVMAHESFENEDTAHYLNQFFVNIKVDREERPDLDKIYQTAHYLLTQRGGGWPLTIFLTPDDLTPFFSGTYFPPTPQYGMPSFKEILQMVVEIYNTQQAVIKQQNQQLLQLLQRSAATIKTEALTKKPLQDALIVAEQQYDAKNGGFYGAPKFPHPPLLQFLLAAHSPLATHTLKQMATRGLYDQLNGGFFRYTVDEKWLVPHFEKMLYDNAQLLFVYAKAAKQNNDPIFFKTARETAHWIIQHMQSPEGGYYSSLDANSEQQEGKYYLWDQCDIETLFTEKEKAFARSYFGFDQAPTVENHWHLHIATPIDQVANELKLSLIEAIGLRDIVKTKMLIKRNERRAPDCDKKILTAWNALMIKSMLYAGDVLKLPECLRSADASLLFVRKHLFKNQRLLASYYEGHASLPAYLDDYVFLIDALLTSLQIHWRNEDLLFAIDLTEIVLNYLSSTRASGSR